MEYIWLAIGIALAGFFIGEGLKSLGSKTNAADYYYFLKEEELSYYVNLTAKEIEQFLQEHPDAPKVNLNGTVYYPVKQFQDWLKQIDLLSK